MLGKHGTIMKLRWGMHGAVTSNRPDSLHFVIPLLAAQAKKAYTKKHLVKGAQQKVAMKVQPARQAKNYFVGIRLDDKEYNRGVRKHIIKNLPKVVTVGGKQYKKRHYYHSQDDFHITLSVLGRISQNQIPQVHNTLKKAVAEYRKQYGKGSLTNLSVQTGGTLRGEHLTLNVAKHASLNNLVRTLNKHLIKDGFVKNARTFHPHVTIGWIARDRGKKGVETQIAQQLNKLPFIKKISPPRSQRSFNVSEIRLFEAKKKSNYNLIRRYKL
jgi:2'-5' RNA ligase